MDLTIIRHGQSEADLLGVLEGRADFALTSLGERQASLAAGWVSARFGIQKIISSPLKRAAQTAQVLRLATNAPVVFEDDLMEWQNGLLAGINRREADLKYPTPAEKYPHTALYGCESDIAFRARAESALSKIINENPSDSCIAIVAHGGIINQLFRAFLRLPLDCGVSLATGDTGVHYWQAEGSRRMVVFSNSLAHLV